MTSATVDSCAAAPSIQDFTVGEALADFHDTGPDRLGRRTFSAHWVVDNVGPRLDERGVRSQMYITHFDAFVDRQLRQGSIVRLWSTAGEPTSNLHHLDDAGT